MFVQRLSTAQTTADDDPLRPEYARDVVQRRGHDLRLEDPRWVIIGDVLRGDSGSGLHTGTGSQSLPAVPVVGAYAWPPSTAGSNM